MSYHAEFETDKIIREKYFSDFTYKGVIVEVGGATPDFLSMSKHFKDEGWRSIIIEPNPMFVELHKNSGNEVYQYACSYENKSDADFTIVTQNVEAYGGIVTDHSFSAIDVKQEYLNYTNKKISDFKTEKIKINIKRLDDILTGINITEVDILSIDTEGWEIEVMRGIDTGKINCKIIVMENFTRNNMYNEYMASIGYRLDDKVHYNYIYVKN
jgi:FkbM family methyltransferase